MDESISVEIDNVLVYRNDKEDILRRVFDHARASVQTELQNMLHEFCSKKEIGKLITKDWRLNYYHLSIKIIKGYSIEMYVGG